MFALSKKYIVIIYLRLRVHELPPRLKWRWSRYVFRVLVALRRALRRSSNIFIPNPLGLALLGVVIFGSPLMSFPTLLMAESIAVTLSKPATSAFFIVLRASFSAFLTALSAFLTALSAFCILRLVISAACSTTLAAAASFAAVFTARLGITRRVWLVGDLLVGDLLVLDLVGIIIYHNIFL